MSLFGWLTSRGSRLEREPDHVFLTRQAKWNALATLVRQCRERREHLVVVAHFPATLTDVEQRLAAQGIATAIENRGVSPGELVRRVQNAPGETVLLLPAPVLLLDDAEPGHEAEGVTNVVVPEMHPLPAREGEVEAFAERLPGRPRLIYLISLEDPMLKIHAGPWVEQMLRHLGMKADEEIQSPLVSRQVRRAQERLARDVGTEVPANSAEEWMEKNLPGRS